MIASAIREFAASTNPIYVAAAFLEETVQIWDLKSCERIGEIPTIFCSGATNLAIAPTGGVLVAGLSKSRGSVAAYDIPNGKKIWEQRFVYPSSLRFSLSGQSVLCTQNRRTVSRLDVNTGAVLEVSEGIRRLVEAESGDWLSVPAEGGGDPTRIFSAGHIFDIGGPKIAGLDARFSPHSICLSEVRGPVRCISRSDGKLQWMFDPGSDSQVVRLYYSRRMDAFWGILWNCVKGGPRTLLKFDALSGVVVRLCEFDSWEEVFLEEVDQLVTSEGEIRDLANGELIGKLAFPHIEYPDQ
jgi:WD40 repeat protein